MEKNKQHAGRWKLFAVIAVCAAPLIASYFMYYVVKPQARTNYGTLLDPREYPMPELGSVNLKGEPQELRDFSGKWVMLYVDSGECDQACKQRLYEMRQLRLTQGKERDRIERVWLVTDKAPIETIILREFDGTHVLRVDPQRLGKWLPPEPGSSLTDHFYLIDPLSNLMMRYPLNADPNKIKKDLSRLLRASSIG